MNRYALLGMANSDPLKFVEHISDRSDIYFKNIFDMSNIMAGIKKEKFVDNQKFKDLINFKLLKCLNDSRHTRKATILKSCCYVIEYCKPYLSDGTKFAIIDFVLENSNGAGHYYKKLMANSCTEFLVNNDIRSVLVFKKFHKILDKDATELLFSKIQDGVNNKEISQVLKKSKYYKDCMYSKYNEESIKVDAVRKEFLKDMAKSKTLCKGLMFEVIINEQDILNLPPVTRFKFLKYIFRKQLSYFRWASSSMSSYNKTYINSYLNKTYLKNKIKVDFISLEKMKEILFPISIKKNNEIAVWLGKYERYLNFMEK